jgi:hypothetical protein
MLVCKICGVARTNLHRHLDVEHQMSSEQYKNIYGEPVVDSSVEEKRKGTCLEKYGDSNYKNEEAKKISNEKYIGGHPFSDPRLRAKACETKEQLYGDRNFTNRDKAKETCLERYGVANVSNVPEVVEKRVKTCIQRYGKIFNWERKDAFTREELVELHHNQGLTLGEIGAKFGQTPEGISYWMKKLGVEVYKKVVVPKFKEYSNSKDDVREYFEYCLKEKQLLSFSEFGKMTSDKKNQKLKRLFNAGKLYNHLKSELIGVALKA